MTNKQTKPISLIAAVAYNNVLGSTGTIPWHIPEDFAYFKKMTLGKPVIMGRKTYESIGKPLPNRLNIVITRNQIFTADGVCIVHSIEQAITCASEYLDQHPENMQEIMIIGGAHLYNSFIVNADNIYLTTIDADIEGDTYFPEIDPKHWHKQSSSEPQLSPKQQLSYTFNHFVRNN